MRPIRYLTNFLKLEAASGILLLFCLVVALVVANSTLYPLYNNFLDIPINIEIANLHLKHSLQEWVNEGLMAIFFMLLTLEIKREILDGELSNPSRILLPLLAGLGGIVIPALLFFLVLGDDSAGMHGWAIPTTTDIALVLGVMAMLGKRVPIALRIMIVALSIVDDIIAIALIAIVYASGLNYFSLFLACLAVFTLLLMNVLSVRRIAAYMLVGIFIWVAVAKSGVHATLAGVIVALFIPFQSQDEKKVSPLKLLEHTLHPWVAYGIMPLFVLMNAGVQFTGDSINFLTHKLGLAIFAGLFLGKQLGVFVFAWVLIKFKLAKLPSNTNWLQLYAAATLTGIGFTMSLFISHLAFDNHSYELISKQSVLFASLCSGIFGVILFLINRQYDAK